ncbi:MAG TPA: hypothetical protein VM509_07660 [Planctomycetota bacterium]|nr:hypothetical protein [Planctomycetota bacterium]
MVESASKPGAAASSETATSISTPARFVFFRALLSCVSRPPIWMMAAGMTALLALVSATSWFAWFDSVLDSRYAPGVLIRGLTESFRVDNELATGPQAIASRGTGAALALAAMLVGAFQSGGWLQIFLERTHGHSVQRFFHGGSRFFFRFVRLLLLSLLALHLVGWLMYDMPWKWAMSVLFGAVDGNLEVLSSEKVARRVVFVQDGLYAALFALVIAWGVFTRTRMALQDTHSAVWAGVCTCWTLLRHPIRTLAPLSTLLAIELALGLGVALLMKLLQSGLGAPGDWMPVLFLFLLDLLALLLRSLVRGAGYHAALQVSVQVVQPLPRPDPWKHSIGGPGGPQYPIGGDEYGVSL